MASKRERVLQEQSEPDDFVPLELTPEQRLVLRTVPFFQLPGYETVPYTANIKARVDTHNPSYKCPRPRSAVPRLQDKQPKQDYSHVVARVDTGRGQPLQQNQKEARMQKTHSSNGAESNERRISTGSDEGMPPMLEHRQLKRRRPSSAGPRIAVARSSKGRVAFNGQDLSQVRAKVDSLQNIDHQPGGGKVMLGKYPKPVIKVTPKVNMRDNIKHIPGGGSVKYPTYETFHFKADAKSKLDCSDPNPAHKLLHSTKELRITGASILNPRMNPDLKKRTLYSSKSFDSSKQVHQATARGSNSTDSKAKRQLRKSATLDSLPSFAVVPLVVAEEMRERKPRSCVTVVPDRVEDGCHSDTTLDEQIGNCKHDTDGKKLEQDTRIDNGEGCAIIKKSSDKVQPNTVGSEECSPRTTKEMDNVNMEASNSKTETIFVPGKLLPLDKGTEGEHEVEDTINGVTATLLVPQVMVYDDAGTIVETIDVAKEKHVYEAAQSGTVERNDGQQDEDDQNMITKL